MGAFIGLLFGVGVLSILIAFLSPEQTQPKTRTFSWRSDRMISIGVGFAIAVVAAVLTGLPFVGLLAGLAGGFIPMAIRKRRTSRAEAARARAWPEVIDSLISAVRAGMSLPEAVAAVGQRGPEELRDAFEAFAHDYRTTGRFSVAIEDLRDRLADPVADRVCEALLIAREVGGTDLGQMLRTLGDFVRQDLRLRDEAAARKSWTVNGARLAVAAPWVVLIFLSTQPEVVDAYRTVSGMLVLAIAASVCSLAYWLMTKLGQLPTEKRLSL